MCEARHRWLLLPAAALAMTLGCASPRGAPAPALDEVGASGLLLEAAAREAYLAVLGPLRDEPWLADLDGPSPENRWIDLDGRRYLLAEACKNHDCYDNNVVLLYAPGDGILFGLVYRSGSQTWLGRPPPTMARELERLWKEEFRQEQP